MIKLEAETHTALLGADEILSEVKVGGNPVYADGKPVNEIKLRAAYVIRNPTGGSRVGLHISQRREVVEYPTFLEINRGDLVSALVIENGGAYRIVGLLAP